MDILKIIIISRCLKILDSANSRRVRQRRERKREGIELKAERTWPANRRRGKEEKKSIIWAFGVERNAQLLRKGVSVKKKKKKTMMGDEEKGNWNGLRMKL